MKFNKYGIAILYKEKRTFLDYRLDSYIDFARPQIIMDTEYSWSLINMV